MSEKQKKRLFGIDTSRVATALEFAPSLTVAPSV
jgi:hypothetical protein